MTYAKVVSGTVLKYPYSEQEFRKDHSNISFPRPIPSEMMQRYDAVIVTIDDAPDYNPATHKIETAATPVLRDGAWVITKTAVAMTQDEIDANDEKVAAKNRHERDNLLLFTDWVIIKAQELNESAAPDILAYRQALRDITSHANWPHLDDADWPTKP